MNEFKQLDYGFQWGSAKVTRLFSDESKEWVTIGVETPKEELQIYVTKTGKIRIHDKDGNELLSTEPRGTSRQACERLIN